MFYTVLSLLLLDFICGPSRNHTLQFRMFILKLQSVRLKNFCNEKIELNPHPQNNFVIQ